MSDTFPLLPDAATTLEISPWAVARWHRLPAEERPLLVDCREEEELAVCAIDGCEWIRLGDFPSSLPRLRAAAGRGIVVYCHHGMRSQRAAEFLRAHGVEAAFSMSGGIAMWADTVDPSMSKY
jgi:rhodanese-related sulfurtransferase